MIFSQSTPFTILPTMEDLFALTMKLFEELKYLKKLRFFFGLLYTIGFIPEKFWSKRDGL